MLVITETTLKKSVRRWFGELVGRVAGLGGAFYRRQGDGPLEYLFVN